MCIKASFSYHLIFYRKMRKITENINKSEQIIKSNRNKWNGNVLLPDEGISKI